MGLENNLYSPAFFAVLPLGLAPVGSNRFLLIVYVVLVQIERSSCLVFFDYDEFIFRIYALASARVVRLMDVTAEAVLRVISGHLLRKCAWLQIVLRLSGCARSLSLKGL